VHDDAGLHRHGTVRHRTGPGPARREGPQAVALGYVADAKRVDVKKFPKFVAGRNCANCALFQGKATDKVGGCPLFAGKQVAGPGWCSAWAKKA
jgi:hypothetical protein